MPNNMSRLSAQERARLEPYRVQDRPWRDLDPEANRYDLERKGRQRREAEVIGNVGEGLQTGARFVGLLPPLRPMARAANRVGKGLERGMNAEVSQIERRIGELEANRREIERRSSAAR